MIRWNLAIKASDNMSWHVQWSRKNAVYKTTILAVISYPSRMPICFEALIRTRSDRGWVGSKVGSRLGQGWVKVGSGGSGRDWVGSRLGLVEVLSGRGWIGSKSGRGWVVSTFEVRMEWVGLDRVEVRLRWSCWVGSSRVEAMSRLCRCLVTD